MVSRIHRAPNLFPQMCVIPFVGAIFASKTKCCTCNLFLALESHIGKTPSLFLPYKA